MIFFLKFYFLHHLNKTLESSLFPSPFCTPYPIESSKQDLLIFISCDFSDFFFSFLVTAHIIDLFFHLWYFHIFIFLTFSGVMSDCCFWTFVFKFYAQIGLDPFQELKASTKISLFVLRRSIKKWMWLDITVTDQLGGVMYIFCHWNQHPWISSRSHQFKFIEDVSLVIWWINLINPELMQLNSEIIIAKANRKSLKKEFRERNLFSLSNIVQGAHCFDFNGQFQWLRWKFDLENNMLGITGLL